MIKILILTEDRDTWVQKITSELRSCKGECWSCVILDQYIPHELEVCVLRPCVKSSIIRTKNYQIGWEANENAGNFDN